MGLPCFPPGAWSLGFPHAEGLTFPNLLGTPFHWTSHQSLLHHWHCLVDWTPPHWQRHGPQNLERFAPDLAGPVDF